MTKRFRKAIGPVVAIALLIVVAVVAVIGFQNWFGMYSSGVYVKTEKESQTTSVNSIETIVGNQLYIKVKDNTSIKKVLIDGNECFFTGNISGVQNISVEDCIDNLSTSSPEVVVILDDKIISKTIYLKDALTTSVVTSLDIGSECRFKDDKSACGSYYVEKTVDSMDVIEDTILGLYWQKNMSSYLDYDGTSLNWTEAQDYCENYLNTQLSTTGWRLPTLVELEVSLVDTSRASSPYIVDAGFTGVQDWYWTNTKHSSSSAYGVLFGYGGSSYDVVPNSGSVVCVKTAS